MAKRPAKPADMSWVIPYLAVKDVGASLELYQKAFGFEKKMAMPGPDGKIKHAEMIYRDCILMFGPAGDCGGVKTKTPADSGVTSPIGLYFYCEDVDAMCARAQKAGLVVIQPPTDQFYGDRVCQLRDPDGYNWGFAINVADFDPSKAPKA